MSGLQYKTVAALALVIAVLVILVSAYGLLTAGFYVQETPNWQAQVIGQDMIDLFVLSPLMVILAVLVYNQRTAGVLLLPGALFYTIYTFTIYSFALHFNSLFIVYCAILGLSFYLLLYMLMVVERKELSTWYTVALPSKAAGIYLIAIAAVFYFLWLAELVPASLRGTAPAILAEVGLLTNPVHALDLSVCLPALAISGNLLLKKHPLGVLLGPSMLFFSVLMDITIGGLALVMNMKGVGSGDYMLLAIMAILAVVSLVLLIRFMSTLNKGEQTFTREYVLHH